MSPPGQRSYVPSDRHSLQGRHSHNYHVQLTLGQEEAVGGFQGETCLRPVSISACRISLITIVISDISPMVGNSFMVGNTYVNPPNK